MKSEEIVARARALVGVPFRSQGRSAELGLDCIGVAAMAANAPMPEVYGDYSLRSFDVKRMNGGFRSIGFRSVSSGEAEAGDLLVVAPGPGQLHIVVLTREGYIHADMRLRRVVEVPGAVPWPVLSAWRHPDHEARTSSRGRG